MPMIEDIIPKTKPLTVYRASAGSGKTFRLAVEYIKLVVQDPQCYRSILAVTFTNKATEEMKMRILSQLYGIWHRLPDSTTYMDKICSELDASPEWVSDRAGIALQNLLHNYSHFRVMTIDTFFQSVLRNLARELDLTASLRIGLNDSQVEEMAVDQLIEELKTTDQMLTWILKYIMENISDDRSWNVIGQIKQFGKTIFHDFYKEESPALNAKLQEKGFFDRYTQTLRNLRDNAKKYMEEVGNEFFAILEAEGLTPDDLANKRRGISSFFNKLRNGEFDESVHNATVDKCLEDPKAWYTKSHPRGEYIHSLVCDKLTTLLRLAVTERPRQWKAFQSANLTLRHINQLRLLNSIDRKVRLLNEESNRFLLSDTQQLLHTLINESDTPFIFEKIGTQLEHIMIDEFQDTSTVQWQNFRVLLQEAMSHEGSQNLIVGDVKQSIYRWRSGDWRLLNDIDRQFPGNLDPAEPLDTNRRSLRNIIEFNNEFFSKAVDAEHLLLGNNPESDQLTRAYREVVQKVPLERKNEGLVNVRLLPDANYHEETLNDIVSVVDRLTDAGVRHDHIAILVRTNDLIPLIAAHFAAYRPDVSIVSDEAFRLDASLAVNIIVKAMHLLTHPNDMLARAFLQKSLPGGMPPEYDSMTQTLVTLPLNELAERLFAIFNLNRLKDQSGYVCAFFDRLMEYMAENIPSIDGFVKEWEENLAAKTIQADQQNGIRLISIHKSKGLEFDNVIVPFCDWQLEKQSGNILWCRPAEQPYAELPIAPIDYSQKGMKGTIYEDDYHHEHLQNVVDNLNLLYVAFTRAGRNLFVIGRRGSKNSRSAIIEAVLPQMAGNTETMATLTGMEDESSPLVYEYGELSVPAGESVTSSPMPAKQSGTTQNVFLKPHEPLHVEISSFSRKATFLQSNQSRQFTEDNDSQPGQDYIHIGSVLHNVFSTIHTTADIDHALQQLQSDGILTASSLNSITAMLRKRLDHPKVADWFSPKWKLFNECSILSVEDGKVVTHRPDRVMTDGQQWIVVDFKFGHHQEEHIRQVYRYMQLLGDMGCQNISGYLWYVYSNQIVEVPNLKLHNPHTSSPT